MTTRHLTLSLLAATTAGLAVALMRSRRTEREGWRRAAFWQRECAAWMEDSSHQARIIAEHMAIDALEGWGVGPVETMH